MTYTYFNYIHYTIGLISPSYNLLRALFMTVNNYALICRGRSKANYRGEISIYGGPILYLILQIIVLSAFLIYWDSGRSLEVFGIRPRPSRKDHRRAEVDDAEKSTHLGSQGPDATEDPARLSATNDGLRIVNASKSFGSNVAVQDVSFGILPSEKFALLGANGAGKSTMISLIRGDIRPTSVNDSSIYIGNDSLQDSPVAAKHHLGVCPQFDAIDAMTLMEHLHFYARARGVPNKEVNITEIVKRLGLEDHVNKLARKLSGGTKRKLSLAIALIANPAVLLLDEPSSGMDPAAKRLLWSTLSAIAAGRVLLITTHSMEEADALCDRAGIMAGRLLALGSVEDLRARHGNAVFAHLVHRDAPHSSGDDMERMRQWVIRTFPNAVIERLMFGGQLRFSVPRAAEQETDVSSDMGNLFKIIEEAKGDLGVVDHAIGPATLDQVFLEVVGRHNVPEENTEVRKRKSHFEFRDMFGR